MASTDPGQAIGSAIGLTCIGNTILTVGQPVEIMDDYEVDVPSARASINVIGTITKANTVAGGDVTVECRGSMVRTMVAGAAVAVGAVVVDDVGKVQNYDAAYPGGGDTCCAVIGWALHAAVLDADVDVLWF